jgi:hypothetical protein
MKLASFDLEISKELPDRQCPVCLSENVMVHDKAAMCKDCGKLGSIHEFRSDWKNHRPLGITCAAVHFGDYVRFWEMDVKVSRRYAIALVGDLQEIVNDGYTIVGFNSLSFDFDVLAEESNLYHECAELALNSIDIMFIVVTLRGHFLGLDKACKGANIQGKLHDVTLTDGTKLTDMSGGKAPGLWKAGEYQAVLDYLADDVRSTLELAEWIKKHKMIRWISEKGYEQKIPVPKLYTVRECLELNPVLPGWVTNPVTKQSMMEWIK